MPTAPATPAPPSRTHDLDDRCLLDAVRAGDDTALAELHRRYWTVAVRVADKILRHREDAQEAAAEGFARILAALRAGKGPTEQFGGYLTVTVRNVALARIRHRAVSVPLAVDEADHCAVPDSDDPLRGETPLMDAFVALRPRWREVLWLTEVEGWTSQELAAHFGSTPNTMAAVAYRARTALRSAYVEARAGAAG